MFLSRFKPAALAALVALLTAATGLSQIVIFDGHIDLVPGYDASTGTWSLISDYSGPATGGLHDPRDVADVIYFLSDAGIMTSPGGIFGTQAGDPIWVISQVQDLNTPWLGTGGYDSSGLNFNINFVDFRGPDDSFVALWTSGSFGEPTWLVSSDTSELAAPNSLLVVANSHTHYNWGFTKAGLYEIDVTLSATIEGQVETSDMFTLQLSVSDYPTVVPEPSAFALIGGVAAFGAVLFRRRGRPGSIQTS